jgi:hypothetical protein
VARPSPKVSAERMREWAKSGAEAALKQLRAEIIAIERHFQSWRFHELVTPSDGPQRR